MNQTLDWKILFSKAVPDITRELLKEEHETARNELAFYVDRKLLLRELPLKEEDLPEKTILSPGRDDLYSRLLLLLFQDAVNGKQDALDISKRIMQELFWEEYIWLSHRESFRVQDSDDIPNRNRWIIVVCMTKLIGTKLEPLSFWERLSDVIQNPKNVEETNIALVKEVSVRAKLRKELSETIPEEKELEEYFVVHSIGQKLEWLYQNLEQSGEPGALEDVLREDADVYRAARVYRKLYSPKYAASTEEIDALASQISFIRQNYIDDLSTRMFIADALNMFGEVKMDSVSTGTEQEIRQISSLTKNESNEEKIDQLRQENANLKSKLISEKGKNQSFHEEVDALRRQTEAHSALVAEQQKKEEAKDRELEALRRALLQSEKEESGKTDEEMIAFLADKKICLIGGHPNWLNKIRELFPNWKYYGAAGFQTKDVSSIIGYDCIYLFTDHLDHKTYYRVMQILRPADLRLGYVASINLHRCLEEFCAAFEED